MLIEHGLQPDVEFLALAEERVRLAQALRSGIPGYRVRIIGEDRGTIQILVSSDNDERRPG
jgi:hypothetical protein